MINRNLTVAAVGLAALLSSTMVCATVINFDANPQLIGQSTYLANGAPKDLTISTAVGDVYISGGTVLTQETFLPANSSSLYGTAFFGTGTSNGNSAASVAPHPYLPSVTIDLKNVVATTGSPLNGFYLDVYNGQVFNVTYTVADNAGHSASFVLAPNLSSGTTQIGFSPVGDVITITSDAGNLWDFSIDNITFNEGLSTLVPTVIQAPPPVTNPPDVTLVAIDNSPPQSTQTPEQRQAEGLLEQQNRRRRGQGQGNGNRNDFRLEAQGFDTTTTPVPLPPALPLMLTALSWLGLTRRRTV